MRFVTLFPKASNVHLIKDVGQIPYILTKNHDDIDAILVGNYIDTQGSYTDDVQGLKYDKLKCKWLDWRIGSCLYLLFNAKRIDWLNIYHMGIRAWYWTKIYKLVNRKGKVYLKLDMGFANCDKLDSSTKLQNIFDKCLNAVDLVSVESMEVLKRIQIYTKKHILLIPNGYALEDEQPESYEKENIFLTVGRLGTEEKATEILLEAFAMCEEKQDWELRLIGSVEAPFKSYIENYFYVYPELKEKVKFLGVIHDRKKMAKEYQKAKIFILPSRWESFGLVLPEAASQGCKLILTSAVSSCQYFIPRQEFGKIIPPNSPSALANAMNELAKTYKQDTAVMERITAYAKKNFSWENICEKLYKHLCDENVSNSTKAESI